MVDNEMHGFMPKGLMRAFKVSHGNLWKRGQGECQKGNEVFSHLYVSIEQMQKNLERSRGLPMAEAVMTKLVEKGMGRGEAHELVRTCALKAAADQTDLFSVLSKNRQVKKLLLENELRQALDPHRYLGASDAIVERIVKKLTR